MVKFPGMESRVSIPWAKAYDEFKLTSSQHISVIFFLPILLYLCLDLPRASLLQRFYS
jgi:hypothetical protein